MYAEYGGDREGFSIGRFRSSSSQDEKLDTEDVSYKRPTLAEVIRDKAMVVDGYILASFGIGVGAVAFSLWDRNILFSLAGAPHLIGSIFSTLFRSKKGLDPIELPKEREIVRNILLGVADRKTFKPSEGRFIHEFWWEGTRKKGLTIMIEEQTTRSRY